MNNTLTQEQKEMLEKARQTYGPKAQIAVSAEECCELAQVLLKYLRYEEHNNAVEKLKNDVLTEVADVTIILDHVQKIFGLSDDVVEAEISHKIFRLRDWLDHSNSIEYTTKVRDISESISEYPCGELYKGCEFILQGLDPILAGICRRCSCNRSNNI